MKRTVFHLTFSQGLHVGQAAGVEREAVFDHIPSDTLFAAMVIAWRDLGVNIQQRIDAFAGGEALISSAFPLMGAIQFYPRPLGVIARESTLSNKQLDDVRWVSSSVFSRLVQGESLRGEVGAKLSGREVVSMWLLRNEATALTSAQVDAAKVEVQTRASVDRATNTTNIFHSSALRFGKQSGMWFALDSSADAAINWMDEALRWLSIQGLGGLRSPGFGEFSYARMPTEEALPLESAYAILLSRFSPRDADEITQSLQSDRSAYGITTVGGWCQDDAGKTWPRKRIRMIAEGACIGASAIGQMVNVAPDEMARPVLRNGMAFKVPVSANAFGGAA